MLNNLLSRERESLNTQINNLKKQLEFLPQAELICNKNGAYTKWYQKDGTQMLYIPKKEKKYAEKLALKKFYKLRLEELEDQCKILDQILESDNKNSPDASERLIRSPGYQELLRSYF